MVDLLKDRLWEEIEISYIRQASYWDRVAQLLDFLFFNIRQFDRDGFSGVVDRIHSNYASILLQLSENASWTKLREYHMSEKSDGYKWLVRRRNLLVHSLHLRPVTDQIEDPVFTFAFNHLEEKVRKKLKPRDAHSEIEILHSQFNAMTELFGDVLTLCELALDAGLHLSIHKTRFGATSLNTEDRTLQCQCVWLQHQMTIPFDCAASTMGLMSPAVYSDCPKSRSNCKTWSVFMTIHSLSSVRLKKEPEISACFQTLLGERTPCLSMWK